MAVLEEREADWEAAAADLEPYYTQALPEMLCSGFPATGASSAWGR